MQLLDKQPGFNKLWVPIKPGVANGERQENSWCAGRLEGRQADLVSVCDNAYKQLLRYVHSRYQTKPQAIAIAGGSL